jgi:hypothetical protein
MFDMGPRRWTAWQRGSTIASSSMTFAYAVAPRNMVLVRNNSGA